MVRNYPIFKIFVLSFFCLDLTFSERREKNQKKQSLSHLDYMTKSGWAEVYAGDNLHDMLA